MVHHDWLNKSCFLAAEHACCINSLTLRSSFYSDPLEANHDGLQAHHLFLKPFFITVAKSFEICICISGPYGINHGIELHSDVVTYARERLEQFKLKSDAIDEFEMCEPVFQVGNCLQFNSGCRLYDRVYCGASCPPEHENYMKNLIAVNGILVMPLNDQVST